MEKVLLPQETPALGPLANSHASGQVEAELKALFMELFESHIRMGERTVNTSGMAHLGAFSQIEQAVKAEGLALIRRSDEEAMRYVFRAWKARNPKRGLHMLRTYLQLLWPNSFDMNQMWAEKGSTYPTVLTKVDGGNHYLTSRVEVRISASTTDGADVAQVAPSLRSVLPARLVLKVTIEQIMESEMAMANAAYGLVFQAFEGVLERPDDPLRVAQTIYSGATVQIFTGTLQ